MKNSLASMCRSFNSNVCLLAACLLLLTSCTTPVGADKTSVRIAYGRVSANGLEGQCSSESRSVLHRFDLEKKYSQDPAQTLRFLHERACADERRDLLFALAELNYLYADRLARSTKSYGPKLDRDYYLSAAIYAYLYLLGPGQQPPPGLYDRRSRNACDLYNAGLARGLGSAERTNAVVLLQAGPRQLPPGRIDLLLNTEPFPYKLEVVDRFLSADQFLVRGLSVRTRQSGLGAPLIAVGKRQPGEPFARRQPATVFLRVPGDLKAWSAGDLKATLELYSGYGKDTVEVNGATIPLEIDITAPLANSLNDTFMWNLGMAQFFSDKEQMKTGVYLTQPYQKGRVPVVLVHGTFSSPVWWAEMMNTLRSDPKLRERCQFWVFVYNSGNPLPYSALRLREALAAKVKELDPDGKDEALQQMVVIGHSQGGLLTKLAATDTGDAVWQGIGIKTLEDPRLTAQQRDLIRRYTVYEHLPFVKRVVFISTPHRGSYLASNFARSLARKFVSLPGTLRQQASELTGVRQKLNIPGLKGIPTSLDSMSSDNKYLLSLAEIPLAPGVKGHSIIAVEGEGDYHQGKDGLVAYSSAHVDYVESEFIVRSFHSCQDKPPTIEEVRRILREHLAGLPDS
ncbi:MAG: alpha/beta fold hydrolase [Verrucomicrobia bacterium]|nr:alpha/beta fold hydrolase [Verrucomicrobiota bacterium]